MDKDKYDRTEAEAELLAFVGDLEPPIAYLMPEDDWKARLELLSEFRDLAKRFKLHVGREENGVLPVETGTGKAVSIRLIQNRLVGRIAVGDEKNAEIVPLNWNPFLKTFEGKDPDPASPALGYLRPRRSALAVLTEVVIRALKAKPEA